LGQTYQSRPVIKLDVDGQNLAVATYDKVIDLMLMDLATLDVVAFAEYTFFTGLDKVTLSADYVEIQSGLLLVRVDIHTLRLVWVEVG
jgi:hypothetical protein